MYYNIRDAFVFGISTTSKFFDMLFHISRYAYLAFVFKKYKQKAIRTILKSGRYTTDVQKLYLYLLLWLVLFHLKLLLEPIPSFRAIG